MAFSWKQEKVDTINRKVKRAKLLAHDQHTDFKRLHPSEARDASQGKYTLLEQRVRKEVLDKQNKTIERRNKLVGK